QAEVARILRSQAGAGSVIQRMTPGIGRLKLQPMRGAFLKTNLHRVVVGDGVGAKGCNADIKYGIAVVGKAQVASRARRGARSHPMSRAARGSRAAQQAEICGAQGCELRLSR